MKCIVFITTATRQVMWPPPAKIVEPNIASSSNAFKQYTLLNQLTEVEAQSTSTGNAMVINEPTKPIAGPSKHPDDTDVDDELIY